MLHSNQYKTTEYKKYSHHRTKLLHQDVHSASKKAFLKRENGSIKPEYQEQCDPECGEDWPSPHANYLQ